MENKVNMGNKVNITEILKDCPTGTKLYSPIFGDVYLNKVRPHLAIVVTTDKEQGDSKEEFLYDGRYGMNGECMLFPSKNKTTWEGFQRSFQDGDILFVKAAYSWIIIYKESKNKEDIYKYAGIQNRSNCAFIIYDCNPLCCKDDISEIRLATEEEKEKLFKAIRENGYQWNEETKTLEKLVEPKFKVGDKITDGNISITIDYMDDECYYDIGRNTVTRLFIKYQDDWELVPGKIEPKFKVGDVIKDNDGYKIEITEVNIDEECYRYISKIVREKGDILFKDQDNWELVPDNIVPKFKVGDKIKKKGLDDVYAIEIASVGKIIYTVKNGGFHYISLY